MSAFLKSLPTRLLGWLAAAIFEHRGWFLYPQLVLMVVCVLYTVRCLEFKTSRNDLVGGDKKYHRNFLKYKEEFPSQDDLVVVVESDSLEKNRQFVERLGSRLEAETNLFTGIFYRRDLKMLGNKGLLFVPTNDLVDLRDMLKQYKPVLMQFTEATNLVSLFRKVNRQFRTATREANAENESLAKALPALEKIVTQATDSLRRVGKPPAPGVTALFEGGADAEREMYITFGDGKMFLVTAQAKEEKLNERAVGRMRELIVQTQQEVPGLNVGLTGEPVLEFDEMAQSQDDTTLATIISLIAVALIFIYGYHETGRPLKATICLLVGLAYTMGFTTLTVGHLNILTITFVPILIGLAIDFGVHLITRYEEELRHGRTEREALDKAIVNTGMGIFTGCFTTAGAFFAMAGTNFKGIQEMGIICGGGLLVCLVPMMTLLPVLLLRGRQNVIDHEKGPVLERQAAAEIDQRARIENIWLRRPVTTILVTALLCTAALTKAQKVFFDYNLLNMQSAGLGAVIFQDKLIQSSARSVLYGAVMATNLTDATSLEARLKNLPAVASIDSMTQFLTEDHTPKLKLLGEIKAALADVRFAPVDASLVNVSNLNQTLYGLHGYLTDAVGEAKKEDPKLGAQLALLRTAVGDLLNEMRMSDRETASRKLAVFQQAMLDDVRETFRVLQTQDDRGGLRVADLPESLRNRFVGVTGTFLLQVYPKEDVWQRDKQENFVKQLRIVDPNVTGTPVQLLEYTSLLKSSFEEAALYSLCAIVVLVFLHFHRVSCVLMSLLPVGIGTLWMVGIMGATGVPFNPANIMTLPLIIGVGVTNGIHILNRFAEEQHPSILAKSTGKAVLVSGLTTIAGFGSLALAKHRGIQSLGIIMAIGTATCMIAGLTVLPAILNLLDRRGWTLKKTQRDNAQSPLGREEPR